MLPKLRELYRRYPFLVIGICVFLVLVAVHNYDKEPFQKRYYICIEYLKEGTLYEGQLYCQGGFLAFYVPYLIQKIFGEYFSLVMHLLLIGIQLALYLLVLKIITIETKKLPHLFLYTLLYLLFIYLLSTNGSEHILDTDTGVLFLVLGVFILYYTDWKWKVMLAVFSMLVSVLHKFTAFFGVIIFLALYLIKVHPDKFSLHLSFGRCKELFIGIILAGILVIALTLKYPLMWIYAILTSVSTYQPYLHSHLATLSQLFLFPPEVTLSYLLVIIIGTLAYFIFVKKEYKPFLFYVMLGWPLIVYSGVRYHQHNDIFHYYTLPIMPFLIISFFYLKVKYYDSEKGIFFKFLGRCFLSVVIFLMITYHLKPLYEPILFKDLETKKEQIQNAALIGLRFMEFPSDTKVLIESPYPGYTQKRLIKADPRFSQAEFIEILTHTDPKIALEDYSTNALKILLGNHTQDPVSETITSTQLQEIILRIKKGEIGIIIESPPQWANIRKIVQDPEIKEFLNKKNCSMSIPDWYYFSEMGTDAMDIYFYNQTVCSVNKSLLNYYQQLALKLCPISKIFTDKLKNYLRALYKIKSPPCTQSHEFIEEYDHRYRKLLWYYLVGLLFIVGCNFVYYLYECKTKKRSKKIISKML